MKELQIQSSVNLLVYSERILMLRQVKGLKYRGLVTLFIERSVYRETGHSITANVLCSGGKRRD